MTDSAYADYNKYKIDKKESEILDEIRAVSTKGDWDEVSRIFSLMPGINSPKGFITSKDLLAIIDAPAFAKSYELDSSLQYIFNCLHKWVYPGGKETSEIFFEENKNLPDHIFIDIPGGLKVWPREFNERGRNPEAIEIKEITDVPNDEEIQIPIIENPETHTLH